MESWNCECGNSLSTNSHKNVGGVNDSYVLIYKCNKCNKKDFAVTKNTTSVIGATVLEYFDKEIHSQEEIDNAIKGI